MTGRIPGLGKNCLLGQLQNVYETFDLALHPTLSLAVNPVHWIQAFSVGNADKYALR